MLSEDAVYIALRIKYSHILFTHHDQSVALLPRVFHNTLGIRFWYCVASHSLFPNEAEGAVSRHISVDKMLYRPEIGDDDGRSTCGNKYLVTISLCLCQCQNGRRRYLMGFKTHQRTVNIKKQGVLICS